MNPDGCSSCGNGDFGLLCEECESIIQQNRRTTLTESKFVLIGIATIVLAFLVQVFVLMFGWGLEPQSWLVIVSGFIFTLMLHGVSEMLKGLDK
jgi:hypothetical protein